MSKRQPKPPTIRQLLGHHAQIASPLDMSIIDTSTLDRTEEAKKSLRRLETYCALVRATLYDKKDGAK